MKKIFFIALLLCYSIASNAIEITKLTCEFQQNPLAINTLQPRFGWQMKAGENETMQSAYELEMKAQNFEWKSGKVTSDKSQLVKYTGPSLESGEKYQWHVRVWDEKDIASSWSDWAIFRTAHSFPSPWERVVEDRERSVRWIGAIRADSAKIIFDIQKYSGSRDLYLWSWAL